MDQQAQIWSQLSPYQQFQLLQQQSLLSQGAYYDDLTPEDTEWFTQSAPPDPPDTAVTEYQRLANTTLDSWKLHQNEKEMKRMGSRLNQSGRGLGETSDLKGLIDTKKLSGLYKAAFKGDAAGIMSIVKRDGRNAPLNELDKNGCTPLMYAALSDSDSAIEMLLNLSVRREQVDAVGRTAVHYAAFFGKAKALKFLIESGSDWTPRDAYGRTPFHWATASKNTKCLLILLNYASIVNGNINPQDNEGMTPVHCAAQFGSAKHIALMIEANCDFSVVDIERKTVLHWTVENKDMTCLHAIVNHSPYLLNRQDINGQTLLHISSKKGNGPLVERLLNIDGIEIDTRDKQDCTPLLLATMEGHSNVVDYLLDFHALDSCIDASGLTALHYAVQINSVNCVKLLVENEHATHIPSANEQGLLPLSLAAIFGFSDIIKALLVNPHIANDINRTDSNTLTAMHYACHGGFFDCVVTLLQHGSDPNQLNNENMAPLDIVCESGFYICIGPLISGGADAERIDNDGYSVLHRAILSENSEILKALINANCNAEVPDSNGRTPLELSVYVGNKDMTALLLQSSNTDPNSMDAYGLTMLHIAAREGKNEILQLLLVNNGYINNMDATVDRYTPLDYAIQGNHFDCMNTLKSNGGMTVDEIRTIAAVWIQSSYRKYKATKLLKKLRKERSAAVCLQKICRGFIQHRRFNKLQKELKSSITIQAVVRGFLARRSYQKLLQKHNEEQKKHQLIEEFGQMFIGLQKIEPIVINTDGLDMKAKDKTKFDHEEAKKEQQYRIEQSMRMRERYIKEQKEWESFRLSEKQRRIDKAYQEEQSRLMTIIENSKQRRKYFEERFKYTITIQCYHQAAVVIQRAYRKARIRRERKKREEEIEKRKQRLLDVQAARVIQRSWRRYKDWKRFEAHHLNSIITSPVVVMPKHHLSSIPIAQLYERSTIVSSSRRRKLHKTSQSGFKIFKALPSTSQSYTRPCTNPGIKIDPGLSPRMKSMTQNWPWSKELILTSDETNGETLKLPNIMLRQHNGLHSNNSSAMTPIKLPLLK